MVPATKPAFTDVTEVAGTPLSAEGASMLVTRYALGAELSAGRRVLEVACGSGVGLQLLNARARSLVGGDLDLDLLQHARTAYSGSVPLVCFDAQRLPFAADSLDLILFFEATYYVPDLERAFDEITRVLRPGGTLLIVSANPARGDFLPSPHSHRYCSATEFRQLLERRGLVVRLQGAYPVADGSNLRARAIKVLRRALRNTGLTPRTLRLRAVLKRLAYGPLRVAPAVLASDFAAVAPLHQLDEADAAHFKVLYVTATRSPREATERTP